MLHISTEEFAKLTTSLASLEVVLQTLDELGAGIAAIHVDAAINQLRSNIEILIDPTKPSGDFDGPCGNEQPIPFQ